MQYLIAGLLLAIGSLAGYFIKTLALIMPNEEPEEEKKITERTCPYRSNISCDTKSDDECGDCEIKR